MKACAALRNVLTLGGENGGVVGDFACRRQMLGPSLGLGGCRST
jgi:hypothetical protein